MQLTRGAEYAIRAVLDLSLQSKNARTQLKDIAERMDIPDDFLAKIFQMLNRNGIIKSYRGTRGGYALATAPENVSVKDVIAAVDGPMKLNRCIINIGEECTGPEGDDAQVCERRNKCPVHNVWEEAQAALLAVLQKADFKKLSSEITSRREKNSRAKKRT